MADFCNQSSNQIGVEEIMIEVWCEFRTFSYFRNGALVSERKTLIWQTFQKLGVAFCAGALDGHIETQGVRRDI